MDRTRGSTSGTSTWSILLLTLAAVGPVFQAWNYFSLRFDVLGGPYDRLAFLLLIVAGSAIAAIVLMRQTLAETLAKTQRFAHRPAARTAASLLLFLDLAFILALGIGWATTVQENGPLTPSTLPEDVFGIAIALIGEGQESEITNLSLQAANDLYEEIENELRRTGLIKKVALQVIGPVSNDASALQWGDRVGAEVVVWGRMVAGQPEAIVPRWTDTTHWVTPATISPTEIMDASMKGDTVLVSDRVAVPHNVHASALVGQAAIYLGEQVVAITQFERALDAAGEIPGDTSVLRSVWLRCRGQAHWSAGQPSLARDDFIASVHLRPDVHTYIALGNLRLAENDLPGAIGNYRAALAVDPYGATPYIGLGYAYEGQGDLAAAIGQLEQAKRLRLDFAPVYYGLGILYRDHADVYLAREAFDHCIVLAEEDAELIAAANEELRTLAVIPVTPTSIPVPTIAAARPPTSGDTISAPTGPADTAPTPDSYVVQSNDNLTTIAARFGVSVESIVKANNLRNANAIYVGQELVIPAE